MAIIDVVQWDPAPNVFAWKFPNTELNTKTQLIVKEGQEAFLFRDGVAIGPFGPGRHILDTANYPVLSSIIKTVTGGVCPFPAEVWFISKAFKLDIKWGTSDPVQVEDPKYHIMLPVRAFGQYGITIESPEKFLMKMIGMVPAFVTTVLSNYFKGIILTRTKDLIANYIVVQNFSVLQLGAHLSSISATLEREIAADLAEYGLRFVNFTVNSITTDENDPAVERLRKALATKAEMDIVGYDYQQKRSFDTMETAAGNNGNGGMLNAGMGMGMGVGMGIPMGGAMAGMMSNMQFSNANENRQCHACGKSCHKDSAFCPHCGAPAQQEEVYVCGKCGKKSPEGSKFCCFCGDIFNNCPHCGTDNDINAVVCIKCGKPFPVKCPHCGVLVQEGSAFCSACGNKVGKVCPGCGKEVSNGSAFCSGCGQKIN